MHSRLDLPRPHETLSDRFTRVAQSHRYREALASETWSATYGELDAVVARLACALIARGGEVGDRVALLMRHDTPQIAAMLAVLNAGRIVVVLNPTDAAARLRQVVEDAEPVLVLADAENAQLADEIARDSCASASYDDLVRQQISASKPAIDPQATAFIVYTSGSTGHPKGVMMNHHQVMHNALRVSDVMGMDAGDRLALLPSLSGLHGVNVAWWALLHGALLRPFPMMERGVTDLADWMVRHRITAFSISTSLFRAFAKSMKDGQRIESARILRVGGEVVTSDDFRAFQGHFPDDCIFLVTLSSSEAGNITYRRYAKRDPVPEGTLAVGQVFDGIDMTIADERGRAVQPGEAGQIVVTSPYMSRGYWRNEPLTAERYSRDSRGVPMVRTGDWGRINADGQLEFVGRKDTRVKIHGISVELDEVEQALCKAPCVDRAVVCTWEGPNSTQLAAYVLLRRNQDSSHLAMRRAARTLLPEHMVPSIFIFVDDFPLTPQGKVDRRELLKTRPPTAQFRPATGFKTATETLLAAIWSEAFDLPNVGGDDNFFELGGDSLIASVIAARVYGATGADLSLDMFADHPTVAIMATAVDRLRRAKRDDFQIRRISREQQLPLSFAQERIWKFSQTERGVASYTLARRFSIAGALDAAALRECMNVLARRHELLRTTFAVSDGKPAQVIHPPSEVELAFVDLTQAADPATEARKIAAEQKAQSFNLRIGPLVRFTLIKVSEKKHWLLRLVHHILCDERSWWIYLKELAELYEAKVRGAAPPLPDFEPLQYADYACWQRQFFRAEAQSSRNMISWWKHALRDRPGNYQLPVRRPATVSGVNPQEGIFNSAISVDASQRLAEIASQENATPFQVGLAILGAFLAAKTGRRDLVLGTYVSNRKRPELLAMFGDFSNLVTLRIRCDFDKTFRTGIMTVRDSAMETLAYSELPYEELRRSFRRVWKRLPEISVIFRVGSSFPPIRFAGLELMMEYPDIIEMPWGFDLIQDERSYEGRFKFDAGRYDPDAVRAMIGQWNRFSETVARHPDLRVKELLAMSGIDARSPTKTEEFVARLFRRR